MTDEEKTLGRVLFEAIFAGFGLRSLPEADWNRGDEFSIKYRESYERAAQAVVDEYERRKAAT